MEFNVKSFKEVVRQVNQASKWLHDGAVDISATTSGYPDYKEVILTTFKNVKFASQSKMYNFCKISPIRNRLLEFKVLGMPPTEYHDFVNRFLKLTSANRTIEELDESFSKEFQSLKLVPKDIPREYRPSIIKNEPLEVTEGNHTYRILVGLSKTSYNEEIQLIGRDDDNLYDYLDKGFYIMELPAVPLQKHRRFIVSNQYDVNTAHIFAMCRLQPKLADMLEKGCFVNVYSAEMLRLKMYKKLNDKSKKTYVVVSDHIESDYKKNTTLLVMGKLRAGEVDKTTVNNVLFQTTSASYENVSIEAEDLLSVLSEKLNFNSEFDIYGVTAIYTNKIEAELDALAKANNKEKAKEEPVAGLNLDEHAAQLEDEAVDVAVEKQTLKEIKINNIPIKVSLSVTGQRYINDIRINKDEIAQALHRASCHQSAEDYKLFLKSISRMSIKWHDIIANGIPFKLQEFMTADEYDNPEPGLNSPAIKFIIDKDDKQIKVVVNKDRAVRINIGRFAQRATTINKRTNNKMYNPKDDVYRWRASMPRRDHRWCAEEVTKALIDCCTFKGKVKNAEGVEQEVTSVLITREDIVSLLSVVGEQKRKMIERSKEFLNTAVRLSGAVQIDFMGKPAYKVKGTLREYAVIIKTAKVYDYDTKQYRCIVNDRHYNGAGYDDVAARLLALKNDSVMQAQIGTLRGAAQPGAENVHDNDLPDRGDDNIADVVDSILEAK